MAGLSFLILFALLTSGGLSQSVLTPNNVFQTFSWANSGTEKNVGTFSVTLTEPGFVTLTDYQCPGDQFKVFAPNNVLLGTTSTPQSPTTCTNDVASPLVALRDARFSKGLFYIPNVGTTTLRVRIIANSVRLPNNRAAIRARHAVCQGPPASQSDEFALVSRLIPGVSAASTCDALGFKLAEITIGNLAEASATANSCLLTMNADSQNQVFIRSWNGDSNFGGVTGSLQLIRSYPSFGHPIGSDGLPHYALCQTITPVNNGGGTGGTCSVVARSSDNLFAIVRPNGLFSNRATACSCAGSGYTLALFPTAQASELLTLSTLVYTSLGPTGRAWVAGYTTPVDNFAFYGPAVSGGYGAIAPSDPTIPIPFVCRNPAGATVIDDGNGNGTGSTCEVVSRSPDNNLAIIRPNGPSNNYISACQCLNFVPAVLSATRPIERDAAYALTLSTVGPTGRVWVGGWEVATDNLAMTAGSATSGAFFVPGEVGAFQYAYLCKNPAAPARRSPQDEL